VLFLLLLPYYFNQYFIPLKVVANIPIISKSHLLNGDSIATLTNNNESKIGVAKSKTTLHAPNIATIDFTK